MTKGKAVTDGWVVVAKDNGGNKHPRHLLVAVEDAVQALEAARVSVGAGFIVELSAPVAARHLEGRKMRCGDVFGL